MDPTEDVSARVLLKHILSTEPPRTPITRSASKAQSSTRGTRRSSKQGNKDAGAQTPQDILRRSLRHKMRESITRKSLPATKRRTASFVLKKTNTPAPASMLFDDGDTPRHILMNILRTEPVRSPAVHEKADTEEPQPSSANSGNTTERLSTELSRLDLPDVTIGNAASIAKGLSRKRPRRGLNVTAFEKRLKGGEDVEGEIEESIGEQSSLSLSSSSSLSLKTPFPDVRTERKGLQRRVSNRRKITEEEFGAAVNKREMGEVRSFEVQGHSETAFSEGFTLGFSKLSEPDITTDIVHCNTALYAQPDAMTSNFSVVATQDKLTVMASQLQRQMMEGEQSRLGIKRSGYLFPTEGEAADEPQIEEGLSLSEEDAAKSQKDERKSAAHSRPEKTAVMLKIQEEEGVAEPQTSVKEGAAESEEAVNQVAQTEDDNEEAGAADCQTEEDPEEDGVASQSEEDVAAGLRSEEEEIVPDSTEEEEGDEASQTERDEEEKDVAATSQSEEEEIFPDSQDEEKGDSASQTEGDNEDENNVALGSQSEEEEVVPDSTEEEEGAVDSQTEDLGAAVSQAEEEEDAAEHLSDQEDPADGALTDSQAEDGHDGELEEEDGEKASDQVEHDVEHISRRAHRSEGGVMTIVEAEGSLADTTEAGWSGRRSKAHSVVDAHGSLEVGTSESGQHQTGIPDMMESSTEGQTGADGAEVEPDADKENSCHLSEHSGQLFDESPEEAAEQEEEWEEEDDDEENDEVPSKTPAFVREKRKIFLPDPLASPTVLKNIQASSTGEEVSAPKPKKQVKKRTTQTRKQGLPKSYLMNTFKHFAKTKVSADVYPVLQETMDKFFERLAEDLETYAVHAKRKTVEVEDAELLLKRQGYVNDKVPVEVLIEKYLRMDQRKLLIPIATSGNVVIPKKRK